jgi:SAM-dependent methyltransferase
MDHYDHPAPDRSHQPPERLTAPDRFEWTRLPGTGPSLAILGNLSGAAVIELGCGTGRNLAHLAARHGAAGIGVDSDPAKISQAQARYGHLPGIHFTCADARRYLSATRPGSADLVLSIFGACSFTEPLTLLPATAHVLRPGGLLAITLRADDHHDTVVVLRRR